MLPYKNTIEKYDYTYFTIIFSSFQVLRRAGKGLCNRWRDIGTPSGRKSKFAELSLCDTLTP